jgi:hypothetical protein
MWMGDEIIDPEGREMWALFVPKLGAIRKELRNYMKDRDWE